ncbi:MAG: hypothetical protein IT454_07460 [Planctomycetes bacterium]|nr:hypothetical protein [Planctomycetota bacterium]
MLNESQPQTELAYRVKQLFCQRTARFFSPEEHARCPYCFGGEAEVRSGLHRRFCDYIRGRDPVQFGFPEQSERDEEG